jgi:hypothetical protein
MDLNSKEFWRELEAYFPAAHNFKSTYLLMVCLLRMCYVYVELCTKVRILCKLHLSHITSNFLVVDFQILHHI